MRTSYEITGTEIQLNAIFRHQKRSLIYQDRLGIHIRKVERTILCRQHHLHGPPGAHRIQLAARRAVGRRHRQRLPPFEQPAHLRCVDTCLLHSCAVPLSVRMQLIICHDRLGTHKTGGKANRFLSGVACSAGGKYSYNLFYCCSANVHQGWPKFVMSAVHTLGNATVVISGWAPSVSTLEDGNSVTVGGQWPFADNATVTVTKPTALALRVPCFSEVRKTQVLEPFLYQKTNDQFAKTGSGQT